MAISYNKGLSASISSLLRNRNFIFILGIVLGLAISQGATWAEPLLMPALGVAMTLSTLSITNRDLQHQLDGHGHQEECWTGQRGGDCLSR